MEDDFRETNLYPPATRHLRPIFLHGFSMVVFGCLTWLSFSSDDHHNTIYYLTGAISLVNLFRIFRGAVKLKSGEPQARIDTAGLRLFYPSALFWPWPRIKGAREAEDTVIVDLHEFSGVDQGEWNRTEVDLQTQSVDCDGQEIVQTIERGVRLFGSG